MVLGRRHSHCGHCGKTWFTGDHIDFICRDCERDGHTNTTECARCKERLAQAQKCLEEAEKRRWREEPEDGNLLDEPINTP